MWDFGFHLLSRALRMAVFGEMAPKPRFLEAKQALGASQDDLTGFYAGSY